jgi:ketosteroid isomerase-like protein
MDDRHAVERYLAALDRGDLAAAAAEFSDDVLYVRPWVSQEHRGEGDLDVVRGKEELLKLLNLRGPRPSLHEIVARADNDGEYWAEGVGLHPEDRRVVAVFFVHASLATDGRIRRFVATNNLISPERAQKQQTP